MSEQPSLVVIPSEELTFIRSTQQEILQTLKELKVAKSSAIPTEYITAKEYMVAVRICRSKFDKLVKANKIKTIKKRRKIYVPISEIDRYFTDPTT